MNQVLHDAGDLERLQLLATGIFRQDVGVWDARWEFLDAKGVVASQARGIQTMEFAIEDRVLQIEMDVPELGIKSVSHRFFKPAEASVHWISVDKEGDVWTFVEDLESKRAHSLPHPNQDGSCTWLRFGLLHETKDEVAVLMESSADETNWAPIFRQYRERR